jgi:hypothetical protein
MLEVCTMFKISLVLVMFAAVGIGCANAETVSIVNGDFESGLDGWTVIGNGTLWFDSFGNDTHFFGYNGSTGDTTISQVIGDGVTRFDGTYEGSLMRNTYSNKMKAGLRYWLTPDMSDDPVEIWFDWDYGDGDHWSAYDAGPVAAGDLGAEPYYIEVSARLCKLGAHGDCHNFIDDMEFEAGVVPEPGVISLAGMFLGAIGLVVKKR